MKKTKDIRNYHFSDFYCTVCGKKNFPIIRKPGKEKEPGHLKKLYCIYCQKEQNMIEIKQFGKYTLQDFYIEYNNGNFIDGIRTLPYKQFISKVEKKTYERSV